jgi:hypothetical protein
METVTGPVFVAAATKSNACPAWYADIAGLGLKVIAFAVPPAVPHQAILLIDVCTTEYGSLDVAPPTLATNTSVDATLDA